MLKKFQKIKVRKYFFVIILAFCFLPFYNLSAQVIITEINYDLEGGDSGREWVEIKNISSEKIDLTQWKLFENETNHKLSHFQGEFFLGPSFLAIFADNPEKFLIDWPDFSGTIFGSSFSLSNTGESLSLKDENLNIIHELNYNSSLGASGNHKSLQLLADGNLVEELPTPGADLILANSISDSPAIDFVIIPEAEFVSLNSIDSESITAEENSSTQLIIPIEEITTASEVIPVIEVSEVPATDEASFVIETELIIPIEEMTTVTEVILATEVSTTEEVSSATEETTSFISLDVPLDLLSLENKPSPIKSNILINEINWFGDKDSSYHEWLELYNDSDQEIDLVGWQIYGNDGNKLIFTLTKKISPQGYYLIARTTETSPAVLENIDDQGQFSGSGLSNEGEILILKDKQGEIIEFLDFSLGWPAGDNKTKETMQWDGQNWFTAEATPGRLNIKNKEIIISAAGLEPEAVDQSNDLPNQNDLLGNNKVETLLSAQAVSSPKTKVGSLIKTEPSKSSNQINFRPVLVKTPGLGLEKPKTIWISDKPSVIKSGDLDILIDLDDYSITLKNKTNHEINLSGLKLDGPRNSFIIPKKTILTAQSKITLASQVTGFNTKEDLILVDLENKIITDVSVINSNRAKVFLN